MYYLMLVSVFAVLISFFLDRKKTIEGLKISVKKFSQIASPFLVMLIFISIALYLIPDRVIAHYLGGGNKPEALFFASLLGSITLMPGFIAYPLCGILLKKGVAYVVIGAFSTTLMMVGVLTYPIEREYFGTKVTILRNLLSLIIALIVALIIGLAFGEIRW